MLCVNKCASACLISGMPTLLISHGRNSASHGKQLVSDQRRASSTYKSITSPSVSESLAFIRESRSVWPATYLLHSPSIVSHPLADILIRNSLATLAVINRIVAKATRVLGIFHRCCAMDSLTKNHRQEGKGRR